MEKVGKHIGLSERERRRSPVGTPEETLLERYEKKEGRRLYGGMNMTVLIELQDDGSGIFKPKAGEHRNLRTHVEHGTYFKRERASYLIDRFLGFGLVPPTVIREMDDQVGSFQQFVPDSKTGEEISKDELNRDSLQNQFMKLWIFDYIIYNSDRHRGNFLVRSGEDKIYAIDNGLSFGNDHTLFYKVFFDIPISPEIAEGIKKFLSWKEGRNICEDLLRELLSPDEVESCMRRIEKIGRIIEEHGRIPERAQQELTF